MKFLIVDDDVVSRQTLIKMLSDYADCESARNGVEALSIYKKGWEDWAPFDLVTLDISMPEMDGKKVLQTIRAIENEKKVPRDKKVKILMSSGRKDRETILTCVQMGCDDYISKPFDRDIILKKIRKFGISVPEQDTKIAEGPLQKDTLPESCNSISEEDKKTLKETIQRIVQKFKNGNIELPVLPQIIDDVRKVMMSPSSTIDDLAKAIEKDSVISIRIIAGANSPFYRGSEKITTLEKAILRLGFRETGSIVNAITNKNLYETKDAALQTLMEKQWMHSLASAYGAKIIAQKLNMSMADYLFLLGLTHDIGMVLLLKNLNNSFWDGGVSKINEIYPVAQKVHAEFGAAIVKRWGFSDDFIKIILFHEGQGFNANTAKEVLIVNLALNLAYRLGYGIFNIEPDLAQLDAAKLLRINPDSFDEILNEIKENVIGASDVF
jgi:HD-like signal output (HDOD) protein/ActR/RegA family two-component response regulator